MYSLGNEPLALQQAPPNSAHTARSFGEPGCAAESMPTLLHHPAALVFFISCHAMPNTRLFVDADSRSGAAGDWQSPQLQHHWHRSAGSSLHGGGDSLAAELAQDEQWLLQSGGLSPASYGSSSECLANVLGSTLQQFAGSSAGAAAALDLDACSLPWPTSSGLHPAACSCSVPVPCCLSAAAPQSQQSGPGSSGGGGGGGTTVDWQQLLDQWAVPVSAAAIAPPSLEALLAEEDAQLPQQQELPPPPLSQPLGSLLPQAAPLTGPPPLQQMAVPPPPSPLHPVLSAAPRGPQPPALVRRRLRSVRTGTRSPPPALDSLRCGPSSSASPQSALAFSAACIPAPAATPLAIPGVPEQPRVTNGAAAMPAIPLPPQQQQQQQPQGHQQIAASVQQSAGQQPWPPQPPQRKRGRPRVYDTVTPVLQAALTAPALQRQASAGCPPGKKRRGAKPKYVCATQEEAIAKRCDLQMIIPNEISSKVKRVSQQSVKALQGCTWMYAFAAAYMHALHLCWCAGLFLLHALVKTMHQAATCPSCQPPHSGCRRRDRNRQTALATYYRRKARLVELQQQAAQLRAENTALLTLAETAEASEECASASLSPLVSLLQLSRPHFNESLFAILWALPIAHDALAVLLVHTMSRLRHHEASHDCTPAIACCARVGIDVGLGLGRSLHAAAARRRLRSCRHPCAAAA